MRNFGPCMCGSMNCHSCGPAQGNGYCPYCRAWDDEGGCENPAECEAKADEDAAGQEHQYLLDEILNAQSLIEGVAPWDVDEEFYYRIQKMPVEDLRKIKAELKAKL